MTDLHVVAGNFEPPREVQTVPQGCYTCDFPQFNWRVADDDGLALHILRCLGCGQDHILVSELASATKL